MNCDIAKSRLDQRIADLRQKLAGLEAVRAAIDSDMIAEEVAIAFGCDEDADPPAAPERPTGNFGRVAAYLESVENEPKPLREVADGAKMSIHALRDLVYKSKVAYFVRYGGSGRPTYVALAALPHPDPAEWTDPQRELAAP